MDDSRSPVSSENNRQFPCRPLWRRGALFVFSGIDGGGKTTQIERIEAALRENGERTRRVWARGGYTPLFSGLKAILRKVKPGAIPAPGRSEKRSLLLRRGWRRSVWLALAICDLALYYGFWIRWLKLRGFTVLSDRYVLDTELDFDLNFPDARVRQSWLWRCLLVVVPSPERSFMFLVSVEESQRRAEQKNEPFPDSEEVLAERWRVYEAACQSGVYVRIDGLQSRAVITQNLVEQIDAVFAKRVS